MSREHTHRCPRCGRPEEMAAELRERIGYAKRRGESPTPHGRACLAMLPFYKRALAALEEGAAEWSRYLRSLSCPRPAPEEPRYDP